MALPFPELSDVLGSVRLFQSHEEIKKNFASSDQYYFKNISLLLKLRQETEPLYFLTDYRQSRMRVSKDLSVQEVTKLTGSLEHCFSLLISQRSAFQIVAKSRAVSRRSLAFLNILGVDRHSRQLQCSYIWIRHIFPTPRTSSKDLKAAQVNPRFTVR